MRLLLDTQIALWTLTGQRALSAKARDMLLDPSNDVWASAVNIWEVAIKHERRLRSARDAVVSGTEFRELLEASEIRILPITAVHAAAVDDLPDVHGDPFDRMLVAQAHIETMTLLTTDATLAAYGDHILLA